MGNTINQANTDKLFSKPLKVDGLVDYQEGSVVSKTIIDKKAGTVTLFAFGKDQGLSEHTAPFDALVYLVNGEAEVSISDGNPSPT